MSRWDQKTEGQPRSRRDGPPLLGGSRNTRSRSRSRSGSPVERRLREIDEERRRKEQQRLREAAGSATAQRQREDRSSSSDDSNDGSPPAPPASSKVGFNFQKPPSSTKPTIGGFQLQKTKPPAIQLKLGAAPKKEPPKLLKPIANAFAADDSDEEPEEMPAECRMRMRNIGRDTPTSSGPNSFGKTKHGFCDSKKMLEKKLNAMADS